jgi:putative colanic acid biosysnthesis UDP-glucose lipid carrier transferase
VGLEQRFETYAEALPLEFEADASVGVIAPVGNSVLKRLLDIAAASILLIVLTPVLLLTAILIRLDSSGPAFFRQTRLGLNGRPFDILKFRTMTVLENGERILQATRNDPRITRVGRFLRQTSIDELPQLINVLRGEMSLVGPRPHARAHDAFYAKKIESYTRRQRVKPGITGWAQVNGLRGETDTLDKMAARIEYDLEYLRNWTLGLDLLIIARTIKLVFFDRGAY